MNTGVSSKILMPLHYKYPLRMLPSAGVLMVALLTALASLGRAIPALDLRTQTATMLIAETGSLSSLIRNADGRSYLAHDQPAPLLSVRVGGKLHAPESASWNAQSKRLTCVLPILTSVRCSRWRQSHPTSCSN